MYLARAAPDWAFPTLESFAARLGRWLACGRCLPGAAPPADKGVPYEAKGEAPRWTRGWRTSRVAPRAEPPRSEAEKEMGKVLVDNPLFATTGSSDGAGSGSGDSDEEGEVPKRCADGASAARPGTADVPGATALPASSSSPFVFFVFLQLFPLIPL